MTDELSWSQKLERGRWDVGYFAKEFLGITMHPGQLRMARAYLRRTESRWRALYLWLMIAAGNRAGKTLGLAIIIFHSCVYRMGLEPPDPNDPKAVEHWGKIPYHWWHFAVEQAPAEQVFGEIKTILEGTHPAQKDGCPWAKQVGGVDKIATLDVKERSEYAWIKLAPDLGGAEIHFRSTRQKSIGSIGQNMHGLSFDEAGLEPNLNWLIHEVLHARRLGTGGQFILISTASVAISSEFEDLWDSGDPESPGREARRFSMRMSSRENIDFGLDRESFDALTDGMPQSWIDQNIDGKFLQSVLAWFNKNSVDACFYEDLPEEEAPRPATAYVQGLDPGLKDKCWSGVFRITRDLKAIGVSLDRAVGKQTTRGIVALGVRDHQRYWQKGAAAVDTLVDTTALGGHMFRELLEESIPVSSIEFGGVSQVKRKLLSDLRSAIDEGRIKMPASGFWLEARKQLRDYKLLDRKIEQDLVMMLAMIVKGMRRAPAYDTAPVEFDATRTDAPAGEKPFSFRKRRRG